MLMRNQRRRGSALILVMGVLVLLSIIGTAFVLLMRVESHAARNYVEDTQVQFIAREALSLALEHPTWNPPAGTDIDNDNIYGPESALFTFPLDGGASSRHPRAAILKKPFGARLNVNWDSSYFEPAAGTAFQALNTGSNTTEISLARGIASYLAYLRTAAGGNPFPGSLLAEDILVADEVAQRICNKRYGQDITLPQPGLPIANWPGEDAIDDDTYLDDTTLATGMAPLQRDDDDVASWVGLNWRPQPIRNLYDDNGNGLVDESGEDVDEPDEFLQFLPIPPPISPPWPTNDDVPFAGADLNDIVQLSGGSGLRAIVQDVFEVWAPAQGISGYGPGTPAFDYLSRIFTTYNRDYVGDQTPINYLNLLMPAVPTADEEIAVQNDRQLFVKTMNSVFLAGGMDATAAVDSAWQVLANLIDYLDTVDANGNDTLSVVVNPVGWNAATDDTNGNGQPDPGEPNTKAYHGTERQPYFNEFWKYNRRDDRFDNDGDGVVDDDDIALDPLPLEGEGATGSNGYFIELVNQYATPIVLYNNPANATDPTIDWYIRNKTTSTTYRISSAQYWNAGAWQAVALNTTIEVGADILNNREGYLVIESRDYTSDNPQLIAAGLNPLLNPAIVWPAAGAVPPGAVLINLNLPATGVLFEPGDTVELVYSYDPDGSGPIPADDAVVDSQELPAAMDDLSPTVGVRDFAPSFERMDPRHAVCVDVAGYPTLVPTASFTVAESGVPTSGGDSIYNTLGAVNDAGDGDTDPFDGNYDLGAVQDGTVRYDDLVEIPNDPNYKFPNVGALGNLLCVGPMRPDTAAVVPTSPYTACPDPAFPYPLDAKKINFIDPTDATYLASGRATSIFDRFTVWCPWRDGKDNDGDWDPLVDDLDGDGGPSPGDPHVDEDDELYVYGRVSVNQLTADGACTMSALPYTVLDNTTSTFNAINGPVSDYYLTVQGDAWSIQDILVGLEDARFNTREDFFKLVVRPAMTLPGNFAHDGEDNHYYERNAALRRVDRPDEWGTLQATPRTSTTTNVPPTVEMFILPRDTSISTYDGGDLLVDDKQEIDLTVGALMNMIALESELPQEFSQTSAAGIVTYYVTAQLTDGRDVDGIDDDGDGTGITEPDWDEGTVLAEKRIIALVNTALPMTDPRRVTVFNWATEGRRPERD